jgi:hypothetical protein
VCGQALPRGVLVVADFAAVLFAAVLRVPAVFLAADAAGDNSPSG